MTAESLGVLVLVGGSSDEHPISLRSGATVVRAVEAAGHRAVVVAVLGDGRWVHGGIGEVLERAEREILTYDGSGARTVSLVRTDGGARLVGEAAETVAEVDVCFPILHGPGGEDGTLQGFLETVGIPYVGAGPATSAIAMDKLAMKHLTAAAGLPQIEYLGVLEGEPVDADLVADALGYPCYVKPARQGSSFGVVRVADADALAAAVDEARRYDARLVLERAVDAREVEIAALGNAPIELSPIGEILPADGFYDFDAKYVDSTARLVAPAELPAAAERELRDVALRAWKLIDGRGMARIDFFVERGSDRVLLNEINTAPGFTEISMYPRLWREAGVSTPDLVDRLLRLALDKE